VPGGFLRSGLPEEMVSGLNLGAGEYAVMGKGASCMHRKLNLVLFGNNSKFLIDYCRTKQPSVGILYNLFPAGTYQKGKQ